MQTQTNIQFKAFGAKGFATGAARKLAGVHDVAAFLVQNDEGKWGFYTDGAKLVQPEKAEGAALHHIVASQSEALAEPVVATQHKAAPVPLAPPVLGANPFASMVSQMQAVGSKPHPVRKQAPAVSGYKIEKDRPESNGIRRPSEGGMCRQVWDFCQHVMDSEGAPPTVRDVKARAADTGWNVNNAVIEFYQWRKFHGITGRAKKAE